MSSLNYIKILMHHRIFQTRSKGILKTAPEAGLYSQVVFIRRKALVKEGRKRLNKKIHILFSRTVSKVKKMV